MQPFLSVIVPVYNRAEYLVKCLENITEQTFTNLEIILVDDGSTDESGDICDRFAEKDYRVKVIHKQNEGLLLARKTGVLAASGQYVGFIDSDDLPELDMYKKMADCAINYNCDAVICDMISDDGVNPYIMNGAEGLREGYYSLDDLQKDVFPKMMYSGVFFKFGIIPSLCNKIFRREIIAPHYGKELPYIKIGEDAAILYPCLVQCSSMYYLKGSALYRYRRHESQMTVRFCQGLPEQISSLYSIFNASEIAEKYPEQLDYYFAYMTKIAISNELRSDNTASYSEKIKSIRSIIKSAKKRGIIGRISIRSMPFAHKIYFILVRLGFARTLALMISLTKSAQGAS